MVSTLKMRTALIAIDKRLIDARQWKEILWGQSDKLYLYALDRSTIGISPREIKEWEEIAIWNISVSCIVTSTAMCFNMPFKLFHFYMLGQPDTKYILSGQKSVVLMTVTRR